MVGMIDGSEVWQSGLDQEVIKKFKQMVTCHHLSFSVENISDIHCLTYRRAPFFEDRNFCGF